VDRAGNDSPRPRGRRRSNAQIDRIGVVGFGWMRQTHSPSYRSIPACFPEGVAACEHENLNQLQLHLPKGIGPLG
jgi:hypothetical protein